jgi:hypothetical protein
MSILANVSFYVGRKSWRKHSGWRENWVVLAHWVFLLLGLAGTLIGGWMFLAGQPDDEDGRKITFASIVALLTGLFLIIDVLRSGATTERRS